MRSRPVLLALLGASLVLAAAAWSRSAEYDEQYTLFLTGRIARPVWPGSAITAGEVRGLQAAEAGLPAIATDLRATDVHPPLYFWLISGWRRLLGNSLFVARLASVLCSITTLCLVALIARTAAIPPVFAVLLTAGCYGFVYTGVIARGFALAQMLSVAGVALLIDERARPSRALMAGALLGAATFTNYLAAFIGCAGLLHEVRGKPTACLAYGAGFVAWLPADLWFFLAQRQSRRDQFAPFELIPVVTRLARYAAANVFGGLPLYAGPARSVVGAGIGILFLAGIRAIIRQWRHLAMPEAARLLAKCAVAPPLGLLLLGIAFGNSPVELRYLAFATPFVGLLLAAALSRRLRHVTLAVQAAALIGLILRPETMQPARATARAATALAGDGVVLLPRGNDGVGIVGAFADEAPRTMPILIIAADTSPEQIRARAAPFSPVVLALLAQDSSSRATLPSMRAAFDGPCWRLAGQGSNVLAYHYVCTGQQAAITGRAGVGERAVGP